MNNEESNMKTKDWIGNEKSTYITLGASSHTEKDREINDFYETDPIAAEWLLKLETLDDNIWECACVDNKTEYFNGDEWKNISDYSGENVLVYDLETQTAKLEQPEEYIKLPYFGKFHHWKGRYIDMCLTDEHRILFEHRRVREKYQILSAKEVVEKYHKDSNGFRGRIPTSFGINENIQVNETFLRIAIMCQADAKQQGNSYIVRVKKERKIKRAEELLIKSGIKFSKGKEGENTRFQFVSSLGTKTFPFEWIYLEKHLKKAFIDEITKWDGSETEDGGKFYFSTNKHNIDVVQKYVMLGTFSRKDIKEKQF